MTHDVSRFPFHISRAALLLLLIGALVLRVHRLGAQSLWYDEAVTAHVVGRGITELTRWTADDIQPPLYYYVVAGWTAVAGRTEWALRFPSAFFGVLTVALMWAAARRLFASRAAALLAALLVALSPLYVYYAQEARMYTQLTFLGLLAGYALWRAMEPGAHGRVGAHGRASLQADDRVSGWTHSGAPLRWWLIFVAAATAALYTHYFAAFLLVAYALCVLAVLIYRAIAYAMRSRASLSSPYIRHRALAAAAAGATIVLLYAPWLPAMLTRYRVDRSYWQGALKLGEALRHVAISFAAGAPEMMLETDAVRLLPWFGALFVIAVAGLLLRTVADVGRAAMTDEDLSPGPSPRRRGTPHPLPLSYEERGGEAPPSLQGKGAGRLGVTFDVDGRPPLRSRWPLLVLLICLLAPTVGILALASRTPKFNARYLMMASPAYLLLLAGGLAVWAENVRRPLTADRRPPTVDRRPATADRRPSTVDRRPPTADRRALDVMTLAVRRAIVIAAVGFPLVVSSVSLRNWFTDRAFAKAQWRELAATVRAKMAPDEAVVLVSGHAWPAWDYYAADIPAIRLPALDILDVEAVLGFEDGPRLAAALRGKTGVWLVCWQAEAVDPIGFAPYFLDRIGVEQPQPRRFWHLDLRHWRLRADAVIPAAATPAHADGANFAHKLALLGWDDPVDRRLTVYWRTLNKLTADYQVSLILTDAAGREVGRWDGRPAGYDYPTMRWRPGQVLFGRYPLPLPPGAAAGDYYVSLAVYDESDPSGLDIRDVADNPAGKRVRLGPLHLSGQ